MVLYVITGIGAPQPGFVCGCTVRVDRGNVYLNNSGSCTLRGRRELLGLPPQSGEHVGGRKVSGMPPVTFMTDANIVSEPETEFGADQSAGAQLSDEGLDKRAAGKRQLLGACEWGLEIETHGVSGGWGMRGFREKIRISAGCTYVSGVSRRAKACADSRFGERRERTEGVNAETVQRWNKLRSVGEGTAHGERR